MKILITNDDGYFAPGLQALAAELRKHAEIFIVAPSIEQSGISQAITFMRPLNPKPVHRAVSDDHADGDGNGNAHEKTDGIEGFTVNGTPSDCVKLGLHELCPWQPDLVVSGINDGLNVGINVCHSGTVGGAFAASMFNVPAIAISVESSEEASFAKVASMAWPIIEKVSETTFPGRTVLNLNFPTVAVARQTAPSVVSVPVETNPLGYEFMQGRDPKDKPYFWATNHPAPKASPFLTDTQAVRAGFVTLSALAYNPNNAPAAEVLDGLFETSIDQEAAR